MFHHKKKIDFVLLIFGSIAAFVIISVAIILYLLINKNSQNLDMSNANTINQNIVISPEEMVVNYQASIEKQIDLVTNSEKDIFLLANELENNMLQIVVPAEKREVFLNATLQIVRMQKQGLVSDTEISKTKILEVLNTLR
ncbi:MAG: hypothetical protein WC070_05120 [Candidatus Magasanikbacteria bacterium]